MAVFIGSPSMNLIEGGLSEGGFKTSEGLVLPLQKNQKNATTYGVRPKNLHLDPSGIAAEVVMVEPMGSETQVVMRLGGQSVVGIFRERISLKPGETIKVRPDLTVIHLFDKDGQRVN